MRIPVTAKILFRMFFAAWIVLWISLLIAGKKTGYYPMLFEMSGISYEEKLRVLYGDDLYEFLIFCSEKIPRGADYRLRGFDKFSINAVRARYLLWPLKYDEDDPDYEIFYDTAFPETNGYGVFAKYNDTRAIYKRRADQ